MSMFVERRFQPIGSTFLTTQEDCAGRPLKRSNSFNHLSVEHARLLDPPAVPPSKKKTAGKAVGGPDRKPKRVRQQQQRHKAAYHSTEGLHQAAGVTHVNNIKYDHASYSYCGSLKVGQGAGLTEVSNTCYDDGPRSSSGSSSLDHVFGFPETKSTNLIHPDGTANENMNTCYPAGFPDTNVIRIYRDSASNGPMNTGHASGIPETSDVFPVKLDNTPKDSLIIDKVSGAIDKIQKHRSYSDEAPIQVHGNEITWCVRNIPKSMTTRELAQMVLRDGLAESLDFVYVPQGSNAFNRQRGNQRRFENLGYGFVNFADRAAAFELLRLWHQQPVFLPHVQVNVSLAKAQGRVMNEKMFSFGKAGRIRNPMLRPLVYRLDNRTSLSQHQQNDENAFISL